MTRLAGHAQRGRRAGRAVRVSIPVNGVEQGMFLQPRDPGSPVLLFLHGGPGMPESWLTDRHATRLHAAFTVAWWEQRSAAPSGRPTSSCSRRTAPGALWRGRRFSRTFGLWDQMLATDLATTITRLEVPAYFLPRPPRPDRVFCASWQEEAR